MDSKQITSLAEALAAPGLGQSYALIDAALCTDLRLRAPLGVAMARLRVPGIDDEESQSVLPFLLTWPHEPALCEWLLKRTIVAAEAQYAVTWLRSRLRLEDLAAHLGTAIAAVLDDATEILLRIADARVLRAMHDTLDPAQRAQLFRGVRHWWYLDRELVLQLLPIDSGLAESQPAPTPLVLTQHQLDALLDAAEPDFVIKVLRDAFGTTLEDLPPARRYGFVRDQIARARAWGLDRTTHFASYCVLAVRLGDNFDAGLRWSGLLERVRGGKMTWQHALAEGEKE